MEAAHVQQSPRVHLPASVSVTAAGVCKAVDRFLLSRCERDKQRTVGARIVPLPLPLPPRRVQVRVLRGDLISGGPGRN